MNPLAPAPSSPTTAAPPPTAALAAPRPAAPVLTAGAVEPIGPSERASRVDPRIERAAALVHPDRPVTVETRHDEASGRFVVVVRERGTQEVVGQYPPEQLLRFWAAARGEHRLVDIRT